MVGVGWRSSTDTCVCRRCYLYFTCVARLGPYHSFQSTRVVAPSKLGEGQKKGRRSGNMETFGFEPDRCQSCPAKVGRQPEPSVA